MFVDVSMDMYAWHVDNQVSKHFDHEVTDDCIGNYMFLAEHNQYPLNHVLSSSCDRDFEERVGSTDDQDLITRELESHLFASKDAFMDEQLFYIDQPGFKDPVAALMESYNLDHLKISDFTSPTLLGEYGFSKDSLSLILYLSYYQMISDRDKVISVLKLLEWVLWKFSFT